jgi:hypothetical protein
MNVEIRTEVAQFPEKEYSVYQEVIQMLQNVGQLGSDTDATKCWAVGK